MNPIALSTSWGPNSMTVNWAITLPITVVVVAAMIGMLTDAFSKRKEFTAIVAAAGLVVAIYACLRLWGNNLPATFAPVVQPRSGQLVADDYALFLSLLFCGAALLTVWMSHNWLEQRGLLQGEYHILLLFAVAGMMLMVQATELITIFLGLEIFSISLYVLSAFHRTRPRSAEAGLKYLLLGAFSSAFFLYGIALVYGATGTTNLNDIPYVLGTGAPGGYLLPVGIGLLLVGLGFKVAAVPFHVWTPDVYEGAPTPITAFMSVATKATAFGAMGRILLIAFPAARTSWEPLVAAMAVATMVVGNFSAIWQNNLKRLLAYSSVAHAGYVLIGIVAGDIPGVLFYLLSYGVMNLGAFTVVAAMGRQGRDLDTMDDIRGLSRRNPGLAIAMSIFMFSLAGIPPAIGYYGKFVLFLNAVQRGYTGLVIVGVLTSAVSAYYYLRVVVAMWMRDSEPGTRRVHAAPGLAVVVLLCAVVTLIGGLLPSGLIGVAERAAPVPPTSAVVSVP